jgi:acetolactate synthase-1/2/3 large subunit
MTPRWVTACIDAAKDEDTILINEYPFVLEELTVNRPGRFFAHSPAGGLGWAMGAALGAKLGRPSATCNRRHRRRHVHVRKPDAGAYGITGARIARALRGLQQSPVGRSAPRDALHVPRRLCRARTRAALRDLEPSPDYEQIVTASGGYGERVDDPAELPAALQRALHAVRVEGRQAVLNVICEAVYARTS